MVTLYQSHNNIIISRC